MCMWRKSPAHEEVFEIVSLGMCTSHLEGEVGVPRLFTSIS